MRLLITYFVLVGYEVCFVSIRKIIQPVAEERETHAYYLYRRCAVRYRTSNKPISIQSAGHVNSFLYGKLLSSDIEMPMDHKVRPIRIPALIYRTIISR